MCSTYHCWGDDNYITIKDCRAKYTNSIPVKIIYWDGYKDTISILIKELLIKLF